MTKTVDQKLIQAEDQETETLNNLYANTTKEQLKALKKMPANYLSMLPPPTSKPERSGCFSFLGKKTPPKPKPEESKSEESKEKRHRCC